MVLTDILKRWQVLRGRKAVLCTGTDEHGMKIQQAAELAKMPEKEFCDKGADIFKALAKRADLSNDHFVRTTDPDHAEAVKYFWNLLQQRGYIYESKHEGWYSVSDETFYPESAIEKRIDPLTGRIIMASQETGKEVEWTSEPNYHFRLSSMKDQLLKFYAENPEFVVPVTRMKDVIKWVTEDLEDLSLSRPVSRLTWGIRVPNDDSQTIYVWLDALVNYITKAGYPGAAFYNKGIWPADVHVIGKDIVRFHCIYWPAFLLAADLSPPKQVLTHAHWTLGKQKMSKSTGNVVNPFFALDKYGVDVMRFYLAHDGGINNDSDYGNHLINERYDKALKGGIGGLHGRLTRAKKWDLREVVRLVNEGALEGYESELMEEKKQMVTQRAVVRDLREKVTEAFDKLNPGAALQIIMAAVYQVRPFFLSIPRPPFRKFLFILIS
jgi:methionyl-tRNA synthetase